MGEFLGANAFLLAIVLIAAGLFFVFGHLVMAFGLSRDSEVYAWCVAGAATLIGTYYAVKWLHGMIERHLMGRPRRR